jgi:adenylate cyclase
MRTGTGPSGREEDVTVLMADIRGFTSVVEDMAPQDAVNFLNEYFSVAIPPLLAHGAVVDKYLGDGVLAFFEGDSHAHRALMAATALLQEVATFESPYLRSKPLRIGVAVHAGRAMLGAIGPPARREYTIISDAVNVTSRLEELNKRFGSMLIVSDSALAAGGELPPGCAGPESVPLRGHHGTLRIYHLPIKHASHL